MRIEKTDICDVIGRIIDFIDKMTVMTKDESFKKDLDYDLKIFSDMVEYNTISVECAEDELDFVLYDFVKTLSKEHHLAIFAFADKEVEVETVNKVERLRKLSEYFKVILTDFCDAQIQIHIGFFTCEFGEKYDVDLIAKTLLD